MRTTIYSGREDENYVETRIRLYQELKDKTSPSIPPDPVSVEATTKCHMQVYIWKDVIWNTLTTFRMKKLDEEMKETV